MPVKELPEMLIQGSVGIAISLFNHALMIADPRPKELNHSCGRSLSALSPSGWTRSVINDLAQLVAGPVHAGAELVARVLACSYSAACTPQPFRTAPGAYEGVHQPDGADGNSTSPRE